jgi:DNA polymerase-1
LFSNLGFRTITDRVKKLFAISLNDTTTAATDVSAEQLKEASVLLWLLNSERTNATYEDIVEYGKSYFKTDNFVDTTQELKKQVKAAGLWSLYTEIEQPLFKVIVDMHTIGIKLDRAYLKKFSQKLHRELHQLEQQIYQQAGSNFNLNSPKQLGEVLFDKLALKPKNAKKTATGQRSTKESELEKLKADHPIIPNILRYRELQKILSTYVDALPKDVRADGRVHSELLQTGTATGRMASKDPNLQNIPIRTEEGRLVRRAFVAESGFSLVSIDYSQIELRIAAILSEDPGLIDIFKRGEDVHDGVAMRVFQVAADEVTGNMRRTAKVINFGILYGMGVNALRQNLGAKTSRSEAQAFLNAYFNTFTKLAEYLEETKSVARAQGYTETLFGRRRYFPGITSSVPFIRAQAERMAINAPIQGTAADCMRIAMRDIAHWIGTAKKTDQVRMLLQVHDELIFEIQNKTEANTIPVLVDLMEGVLSTQKTHDVPLVAEVKSGPNWYDMKPFAM